MDLLPHQANLSDASNSFHIGIIKQLTRYVEHTAEQTLQKCRERHASVGLMKPSERAWTDTTLIEASFEVFTKVGQGYRQERRPLVFDTPRYILNITACVGATSYADIFQHTTHEPHKAFH
jgi:hypothetical protein